MRKILFRLERDAVGYPPAEVESLWAVRVADGLYKLDNIPFFVRGVSCGDTVSVVERDGELWFSAVAVPSDHSTVRLWFREAANVGEVRYRLLELGCSVELSHLPGLVAVDIPGSVDTAPVLDMLTREIRSSRVGCEEASVTWPEGTLPRPEDDEGPRYL